MSKILSDNLSTQNEKNRSNFFKKISAQLDPFLIIGVLISIVLALVMVLLGGDRIQSLMIGLITTIITLLIDLVARFKESEKRVLEVTTLGNLLASDRQLFLTVNQIVDNYQTVKRNGFELFELRADDALLECNDIMQRLANGYMLTEPVGKFSFGKKGFGMAINTVKAVSCEPLDLWRTPHWQTGLQANTEAINRGVIITRIFIQEEKTILEFADVLQAHHKAGANVFTVSPQELPPRLVESYFIVDDKILAEFYLNIDGKLKEERISISPVDVDRAVDKFNSILRYAQRYAG